MFAQQFFIRSREGLWAQWLLSVRGHTKGCEEGIINHKEDAMNRNIVIVLTPKFSLNNLDKQLNLVYKSIQEQSESETKKQGSSYGHSIPGILFIDSPDPTLRKHHGDNHGNAFLSLMRSINTHLQ